MDQSELLEKVVKVLESLDIPYLVTGSVAAMAYGEPRLTNDIDIVAAVEERHIARLIEAFPAGEFYISELSIREAITHQGQFNIIHPASGLKVDIIIKQDTSFDNSRFSRANRISPSQSYQANFASPEDLIIKKMDFYKQGGSDKHLRDIASIMKISGESIDQAYISKWAKELNLAEIWEAVKEQLQRNTPSR